jgi:hypothetical protein
MYVRKRVICEWSSWTNFTAMQKMKKIFFYDSLSISYADRVCNVYMQRNGYSFTVFLGETDFYWFDWLKTATDFESLVPRRKGDRLWVASSTSKRHVISHTGPVTARVGERLWKALCTSKVSMCNVMGSIKFATDYIWIPKHVVYVKSLYLHV